MWLRWLPWRYLVRRIARGHGFIDPVSLLARIHRFNEPSEVAEPIELLRAGVVFHARGLINTKAIQHNLDWVWPYWVERQFDPKDIAFIPRAFSLTHVNLTHRNWTAVGLPGVDAYPIVDPRGLLTPMWDGWSLDSWIISDDGTQLIPSKEKKFTQNIDWKKNLIIQSRAQRDGLSITSSIEMRNDDRTYSCRMSVEGRAEEDGWLVLSLRPYNPEGVSFIHQISVDSDTEALIVEGNQKVLFDRPPAHYLLSDYSSGDVFLKLKENSIPLPKAEAQQVSCQVGMATAAALFRIQKGSPCQVTVNVPLEFETNRPKQTPAVQNAKSWSDIVEGVCSIQVPDTQFQYLWETSLRTIVLLSPENVYPGPYTYRRFWFRDAVYMVNAMIDIGLLETAKQILDTFPERQSANGYFNSQEGEWDSNGQVLWAFQRFCQVSNTAPPQPWVNATRKGGQWIAQKRLRTPPNSAHSGLLPAGFSAEHLGPNDYYFWDDFWSLAGLQHAADLLQNAGESEFSSLFSDEAKSMAESIEKSLTRLRVNPLTDGIPASPYRRMDAGAIGSIVVDYPLQLWKPGEPRVMASLETLLAQCFVKNAFFQDMIHSGLNPYLSLHVAQCLLRAEDPRFFDIMLAVANLASPTGQWPEAVHPLTNGGCMGDGQHGWAAAEWLAMLRNCFVREESDRLIIGSGLSQEWLKDGNVLSCGPSPTRFGLIELQIVAHKTHLEVQWEGCWHAEQPTLEFMFATTATRKCEEPTGSCRLERI